MAGISKEAIAEIEEMNRKADEIANDETVLKDDLETLSDTNLEEYSGYQALKKKLTDAVELAETVMNSNDVRQVSENVRKAMESKDADIRTLEYSLYVEGKIKLDKALSVLGFEKEAYDKGSLSNPLRLKGDIRNIAEKEVKAKRSLLVNSIPMDRELLKRMGIDKATEAFRAVYLKAFDDLREWGARRHIEEIDYMLSMEECAIAFVDLPFQIAMIYESALDSTNPIDLGLADAEDAKIKSIREKARELEGIEEKNRNKLSEFDIVSERVRLKLDEEKNVDIRLSRKLEDEKAVELRIKQRREEFDNIGKDEGDGDES